jgi:hypothetical protein
MRITDEVEEHALLSLACYDGGMLIFVEKLDNTLCVNQCPKDT